MQVMMSPVADEIHKRLSPKISVSRTKFRWMDEICTVRPVHHAGLPDVTVQIYPVHMDPVYPSFPLGKNHAFSIYLECVCFTKNFNIKGNILHENHFQEKWLVFICLVV